MFSVIHLILLIGCTLTWRNSDGDYAASDFELILACDGGIQAEGKNKEGLAWIGELIDRFP